MSRALHLETDRSSWARPAAPVAIAHDGRDGPNQQAPERPADASARPASAVMKAAGSAMKAAAGNGRCAPIPVIRTEIRLREADILDAPAQSALAASPPGA